MLQQVLMRLLAHSLDLLFPPQCGLCRKLITESGSICSECWQKLNFITTPYCRQCGYPYEYDMGAEAQCAACMAETPQYHGHRSVLYFDEASKKLVHDLKYHDKALLLEMFGRWLGQIAPGWLALEGVILVPVPLHRWRLWRRKYNQSALLAKTLAAQKGIGVEYDLLQRVKHRPPQVGLTRRQRLTNTRGVFRVNPKMTAKLKGRPVILIDDVMTTGATLNACARTLKKAGSGRVYCLTLARMVKE